MARNIFPNFRSVAVLAVLTVAASLYGNAQRHGRIVVIDVPGAGTGAFQGTFAYAINESGQIAGSYVDANNIFHGFLRSSTGTITKFDVPGATAGGGTIAVSLNATGAIVGYWNDANNAFHAFLRASNGTITSFTDTKACTGSDANGCQGTGFYAINDSGTIVGAYLNSRYVQHGLVVSSAGKAKAFSAPGAGNTRDTDPSNFNFQGTETSQTAGINSSGSISGNYVDSEYVSHGFLRSSGGTFTTFEAPGAYTSVANSGTIPVNLNDSGAIIGLYLDSNSVIHGFLRSSGGTFTAFEAPGADTTAGSFGGTSPQSINQAGAITGYYVDANFVYHGFLRSSTGTFTTFSAKNADTTPGSYNGTFPSSNNTSGAITGYYIDSNNVNHGFVRMP